MKKVLTGLLIIIATLVTVYLVAAIVADPAPVHPYFQNGPDRPWVIAHQGGDDLWPGDTLFALQQVADMGVDVLEMDIHQSADGALVLMHDETVDRTTDGVGFIKEMTLTELQELDAGYDWSPDDGQTFPYRDQGISISTVDEVFSEFPDYRMVIEIKQSTPSITRSFCDLIRQYDMNDKVLVAAFDQAVVDDFRQVCPEVATSAGETEVIIFFILSKLYLEHAYTPAALALEVPETRSGLTVLTPRLINAAHNRGMEVHVWTVDELADQQRMIEMGLDGIITDRPDRLLELLGR